MTAPITCKKIGDELPHGMIRQIYETLNQRLRSGALTFDDGRKKVAYELVYRTMKGKVLKMKPVHEVVVDEAKAILRDYRIEVPE